MLPGVGTPELVVIAVVALLVVGPKDLPVMLRKLGQFTAKMRGLASEFRASFDEMARQSELDELRREVEALRDGRFAEGAKPDVESHMRDIDAHMAGFDPHHAWDGSYADTGGAPPALAAPADDDEPELPFAAPPQASAPEPAAPPPIASATPVAPAPEPTPVPVKAAAE